MEDSRLDAWTTLRKPRALNETHGAQTTSPRGERPLGRYPSGFETPNGTLVRRSRCLPNASSVMPRHARIRVSFVHRPRLRTKKCAA